MSISSSMRMKSEVQTGKAEIMTEAKPYNPRDILLRLRKQHGETKDPFNSKHGECETKDQLPPDVFQKPVGPATLQSIAELQYELAKAHALNAEKEVEIAQLRNENQKLRSEMDEMRKAKSFSKYEDDLSEEVKSLRKKLNETIHKLSSLEQETKQSRRVKHALMDSESRNFCNMSFSSNQEVESLFAETPIPNDEQINSRDTTWQGVNSELIDSPLLDTKTVGARISNSLKPSKHDDIISIPGESPYPKPPAYVGVSTKRRQRKDSSTGNIRLRDERPPFVGMAVSSAKSFHCPTKSKGSNFLHIPKHVRAENRQKPADQKPHISLNLFDD